MAMPTTDHCGVARYRFDDETDVDPEAVGTGVDEGEIEPGPVPGHEDTGRESCEESVEAGQQRYLVAVDDIVTIGGGDGDGDDRGDGRIETVRRGVGLDVEADHRVCGGRGAAPRHQRRT